MSHRTDSLYISDTVLGTWNKERENTKVEYPVIGQNMAAEGYDRKTVKSLVIQSCVCYKVRGNFIIMYILVIVLLLSMCSSVQIYNKVPGSKEE